VTRQELAQRLDAAIQAELRIFMTRGAAADSDRLGQDLGLDSVGLLYLVMAMEEAFGLEIDDAEDVAERFATWGQVLDFLEAACGSSPS
jgi:acyl carrier protein